MTPQIDSNSAGLDAPFLPVPFIPRDIDIERRENGVLIIRNRIPLKPFETHIPSLLRRHASERPDNIWLAQRRGPDRAWQTLTYRKARIQIDALTQALLNLDVAGRTIMALSGNSIELGIITLAAMQARMPIAPITPAYSLRSNDHEKLKIMARLLNPGVIFVQSGQEFKRALGALDFTNAHIVSVDALIDHPRSLAFDDLLRANVTNEVDDSLDGITDDTVAKYLFTSGSTGSPKAVITTQRMMCAALAMSTQLLRDDAIFAETTILDWLPWSHVMGGSAQFNGVLAAGGSLYIDDGHPTPDAFAETIRNLREVSPTRFANVPAGYSMLADALEADEDLAARFFSRLQLLAYAGARLPDELYVRFQRLAIRFTGCRVPFVSGFGATETAPSATYVYWATDRVGLIGLPHPGVELKLVPIDSERFETRIRSIAVTPGYLDEPELTASAFDDEGFYKMGDAATFVDRDDPKEGFLFAGRVTEDFKLMSGGFVNAGGVRVAALNAAAPLLADVVVAGADRPYLAVLAWPNLEACRSTIGQPGADSEDVVCSPVVRCALIKGFADYNRANHGSSTRIARLLLLDQPPSFDAGEITAKGYVNQKAVLTMRSADVARLYAAAPDEAVICFE